jgi:hypothetical protein
MEAKRWYLSKGVDGSAGAILGGLVLLIVFILQRFGIEAAQEQEAIIILLGGIWTIINGIVALVGRLKANTQITK